MRPFFSRAYELFQARPAEGVEVGVARGENAQEVLKSWPGLKLHPVDSYVEKPENEAEAVRRITGLDGVWHKKPSTLAAEEFADASLDLVYLDGDHTRAGLEADIAAWRPKVRPGGMLGGHDFANMTIPDVRRTVIDYVRYRDILLQAYGEDWWVELLV